MKITTLINAMLLSSVSIFTACSSSSPKPKQDHLATLAIIGVDTSVKKDVAMSLNDLPLAKTYPIYERYVRQNYQLNKNPVNKNPARVISGIEANAKRLLGIKYVWGATGPHTYDCSGFTQKIYRDAGINIPRVSRDQARVGDFISYGDLRRGDMVFFDTKKKRTGIVSHVGIYLGGGNFIHASSAAKKIVIYNFNDKSFYKDRFLWGRRVVNDNYFMASV